MPTDQERTVGARKTGAARSVLLLFAGAFSLGAQVLQPKERLPSFEVVFIQLVRPTMVATNGAGSPRKKVVPVGAAAPVAKLVRFVGQAELLIEAAYGLPFSSSHRIVGGPDWIRSQSDRYEVTAKIDDAHYAAIQKMSPAKQQEEISWMEQSLLKDRFQFRAHIETRQLPRYALAVAKSGAKLQRAQDDETSQLSFVPNGQEREMKGIAVSLEELARSPFLRIDERLIVDRTDLRGRFNFTLKFRSSLSADLEAGSDDGGAPLLPVALQEQLGLRLVPENGPVQVVVIDRIERPSEN